MSLVWVSTELYSMSSKYNFLAVERDGSSRNSGFAEEQGRVPDALSQEAGSDAAQDFSEEECELLFGDDVETDDHQGLLYDDSRGESCALSICMMVEWARIGGQDVLSSVICMMYELRG